MSTKQGELHLSHIFPKNSAFKIPPLLVGFLWTQELEELYIERWKEVESGELETVEHGKEKFESCAPPSEVLKYAKFARNHEEHLAGVWCHQYLIDKYADNPDPTMTAGTLMRKMTNGVFTSLQNSKLKYF